MRRLLALARLEWDTYGTIKTDTYTRLAECGCIVPVIIAQWSAER